MLVCNHPALAIHVQVVLEGVPCKCGEGMSRCFDEVYGDLPDVRHYPGAVLHDQSPNYILRCRLRDTD